MRMETWTSEGEIFRCNFSKNLICLLQRLALAFHFFFFFGSAFVYRNSYLVQGQDAVPYLRTKINKDKLEG